MPTLVLSPRYTDDSNALWQAALSESWSVQRLQSHHAPEWLISEDVVIYGEALFVRIIAQQLEIALFETPHSWLADLPPEYRLREVRLTTLAEARALQQETFIKPAADKSFDAKVYRTGAELPSAEYFDDNTPTLLSDPVEWEIEYRCFIAQNQLQTFAPYVRNGETLKDDSDQWQTSAPEDPEAAALIHLLLADEGVQLPPAIVLDIGRIKGKGWAVIEANPAWGSGIYGNQPAKVLHVLRESCAKSSHLTEALSSWVIEG
jgi:hypothetical protein